LPEQVVAADGDGVTSDAHRVGDPAMEGHHQDRGAETGPL
jgi:hypothetical protein